MAVSQGLGTTEFTNLIGWNRYWKRSRFSHLDRHLDRLHSAEKKSQTKMQNYWLFSSNNIYSWRCQKAWWEKSKEDEQTLAELFQVQLIAGRKQTVSLYKPVTLNELIFLVCHKINILLTELSRSDLTSVVCTDLNAFGLYSRPRSRFSHTDLLLG